MKLELTKTHDVYDLLAEDELETVTRIFLEALCREKDIQPEFYSIETNVKVYQEEVEA
jgi:hypothetical protein|tara:strand:- start:599 stop:772 length:174 start_codon:yes stop_codon:yes gene_type:complete